MPIRTLAAILLAGLATTACDRPTPTTAPATAPTTQSTTDTTPAAESVTFSLNNHPFVFAAPRVQIDAKHDRILLYAAQENPTGVFYFEMPIEGSETAPDTWHWESQIQQEERQETLVGIQLSKTEQTLQPIALKIDLKKLDDQRMAVSFEGTLLVYPGDSTVASTRVPAVAKFIAAIEPGE